MIFNQEPLREDIWSLWHKLYFFFQNEGADLEHINTETLSIIICLQFSKNLLQA